MATLIKLPNPALFSSTVARDNGQLITFSSPMTNGQPSRTKTTIVLTGHTDAKPGPGAEITFGAPDSAREFLIAVLSTISVKPRRETNDNFASAKYTLGLKNAFRTKYMNDNPLETKLYLLQKGAYWSLVTDHVYAQVEYLYSAQGLANLAARALAGVVAQERR